MDREIILLQVIQLCCISGKNEGNNCSGSYQKIKEKVSAPMQDYVVSSIIQYNEVMAAMIWIS